MPILERFDYFGIQINAANLHSTIDYLLGYDYEKVNYVLFPDSSVVASCQQDLALRKIVNKALLTLPDGLPSALYARFKGFKNVSTVSGFRLCDALLKSNLSHFFLGSSVNTIAKIRGKIETMFPSAIVLGYSALPFHETEYFKNGLLFEEELSIINQLKPDLIWIGLSSPKQDYLINVHLSKLKHGIFLGVGGVFEYISGDQKKSPEWVKKIGLRWLWRLSKEPGRLGPKYWAVFKFYLSLIVRKSQQ